jgi:hypothetical protein
MCKSTLRPSLSSASKQSSQLEELLTDRKCTQERFQEQVPNSAMKGAKPANASQAIQNSTLEGAQPYTIELGSASAKSSIPTAKVKSTCKQAA